MTRRPRPPRPTYTTAAISVGAQIIQLIWKKIDDYVTLWREETKAAAWLSGLVLLVVFVLYGFGFFAWFWSTLLDQSGYNEAVTGYQTAMAIHITAVLALMAIGFCTIWFAPWETIIGEVIFLALGGVAGVIVMGIYGALEPLGLQFLWPAFDAVLVLVPWVLFEEDRLTHRWIEEDSWQQTRDDLHSQIRPTARLIVTLTRPTSNSDNHGASSVYAGHGSPDTVSISTDGMTITGLMKIMRRPGLFQFAGIADHYLGFDHRPASGWVESITTSGGLELYATPWPETHPGLVAPGEDDPSRFDAVGKVIIEVRSDTATAEAAALDGVTISGTTVVINHCLLVIKRDQPVCVLPGRILLPISADEMCSLTIEADDGWHTWTEPESKL